MNLGLQDFADSIRYNTLLELGNIGYGHYGGALSIVETLAVLYGEEMKYDPKNPNDPDRDYFILSKGHAGPSYYATLSLAGFFDNDKLYTLNTNGTNLPSHPDRQKVEGVDMTTGSLGQGISVACGAAYHLKNIGKDNKVYCILGDGELNEGQVWEALMFASHHKLTNLIVMVDDNKKQLDGYTAEICDMIDLERKFDSFGFDTFRVNGNDVNEVKKAIDKAKISEERPSLIILDTVKGAGVKYIENTKSNHHMRLDDKAKEKIGKEIEILKDSLVKRGLLSE